MSVQARVPAARMAGLLVAPAALAVGAWIWLAAMIGDMSMMPGMGAMAMPMSLLAPGPLMGLLAMWAVMMAAMMLPTAAPMIAAYARMQGHDRGRGAGRGPVLAFAGGYALAWAAFSVVAAVLQAGLSDLALLSPMMMSVSAPLSGGILLIAGAYQFTPLKGACLDQCRSPIGFLMTRWQDGAWGALSMGWRHGAVCVGCCWALMGLLFVVGVMNAAWIVAIAVWVLIEKTAPAPRWPSMLSGAGMIAAGLWIML